jgi:hypothetical protein
MSKILIKSVLLAFVGFLLAASGHAADDPTAIIQAATDYVKKETAISDPLVTVEKVVDGYARAQVKSKSGATDAAIAFLKLEKGKWKVLTLGTAFEAADYKRLKIPAALRQ